MTNAEWADAFRTGDPEKIGETLLRAIRQAYTEQANHPDGAPDIGVLAPGFDRDFVSALMTRTGEILQEWGCLVLAGPEVSE